MQANITAIQHFIKDPFNFNYSIYLFMALDFSVLASIKLKLDR